MTEDELKNLFLEDLIARRSIARPQDTAPGAFECHIVERPNGRKIQSKGRYVTLNGIDLTKYPWFEWLQEFHVNGLVICVDGLGNAKYWAAATPAQIADFKLGKKNAEG